MLPAGVAIHVDELIRLQATARLIHRSGKQGLSVLGNGRYFSRARGRGIDFDEVRTYQAGDDIRRMDWRVTARTGKPHTKLYQDERERPVFFLIDFSSSLYFGSRVAFKSVIVAKMVALLAWSIVAAGDRVGAIVSHEGQYYEFRPRHGRLGVLSLLKLLSDLTEKLPTQYTPTPSMMVTLLERVDSLAKPGSSLILVGDLSLSEWDVGGRLQYCQQRYEMNAVIVQDHLEIQSPEPACYTLSDGQQQILLDATQAAVREQYQQFFNERRASLQQQFARYQIPVHFIGTEDNLVYCLRGSMQRVIWQKTL